MPAHPAGQRPGCRVTPDCTAPAVCRISPVRAHTRPTFMAVRPLSGQPVGYASCADHMHTLLDEMLLAALPAPTEEDRTR